MLKRLLSIVISVGILSFTASCTTPSDKKENDISKFKNVIVLIGDGMGPQQIRAGEIYKQEKLYMQTIAQSTKVDTNSYYGDTTDSAAAATALSSGFLTENGMVGLKPDGQETKTLVDIASELGKRTGVITTEELYGATPMGFSAHATNRNEHLILLESAASTSNVNLFASYKLPKNKEYLLDYFTNNGYEMITNPEILSDCTSEKVLGQFNIVAGADSMTIDEIALSLDGLVSEALEYLTKDEDGFFLMVEGAHIDHGGHNNDIQYMLNELLAFDDAVKYVVEWAKKRDDTLVLVTADHETGGLWVNEDLEYGKLFEYDQELNRFINFAWLSKGHTSTPVWLFAYGDEIDFLKYSTFNDASLMKNVDVFKIAQTYITANEQKND